MMGIILGVPGKVRTLRSEANMEQRANQWSVLGFGCLRFPKKGNSIDLEETERELAYAIAHGVNYLDTAYIYRGSEQALGVILKKNGWREQLVIASKLPHYMISSIDELERLFLEQLKRLQTDYIDNYLMHMLPDVDIWNRLVELGIEEWLAKKKACGQIRRVGFSYHGNTQRFLELLDAYPWEFCQVQYNYMDEFSQAGRAGVQRAYEKGIPVIIMEPLRGGRLVQGLPDEARACMKASGRNWSAAEWGLRWLWNQKEVALVLSGMNSMEMVAENIRIAEETKVESLDAQDFQVYEQIRQAINRNIKVPCTACGYCQPCPAGVDIPGVFRCLNVRYTDGYYKGMKEYLMCTTFRAKQSYASRCIGCGKCEKHCPQGIAIRKELAFAKRKLEGPVFGVIRFAVKKIFRLK